MDKQLFKKLIQLSGQADDYVILKRDDKGFYIEYAFKEGAPHDNRCLSWYDSYQEKAYERSKWFEGLTEEETKKRKESLLNERLKKVGKIFKLYDFTCGYEKYEKSELEEDEENWKKWCASGIEKGPFIPENHICKVGCPAIKCRDGFAHHWTYEEPVKCACWYLKEELVPSENHAVLFSMKQIEELLKLSYE